jgi:hypothetical protein
MVNHSRSGRSAVSQSTTGESRRRTELIFQVAIFIVHFEW